MPEENEIYSYDEVPYPCHPYPQTHPDRLATIGKLFGMDPPNIRKAKILELGCADGSNLIPMAQNLPKSQFVGVDLSEHEISVGQKTIKRLKLKNITLEHKDILDIDKSYGLFDYIIVHGIYSWVPEEVQNKILQICNENLSPNGIAYVSYNTFPGWHMRGMLRDMMRYHTKKFKEPKQQIAQARALINFLGDSVPTEKNAYGMLLKSEIENMKKWQDNYFYHDSLEKINDPIYFHDFAERAGSSELQYLGEAEFSTMLAGNFPEKVSETLKKVGNNIIDMEQYMDFLRNRMFRQTLLCHKDIKLNRQIRPEVVSEFNIAAPIAPVGQVDLKSQEVLEFKTAAGGSFKTNNPFAKIMWMELAKQWPNPTSFDELSSRINEALEIKSDDFEKMQKLLSDSLLNAYSKNLVRFYSFPIDMTTEVSKKPKVSELVREQIKQGVLVTNQLHEVVRQDVVNQHLIQELNGKHDRKYLLKQMNKLIADDVLKIQKQGEAVTDQEAIEQFMEQQLNLRLQRLAKTALLIG